MYPSMVIACMRRARRLQTVGYTVRLVLSQALLRMCVWHRRRPNHLPTGRTRLLRRPGATRIAGADLSGASAKLYPWICARCGREFGGKSCVNLRSTTKTTTTTIIHPTGSNWELLGFYCHDNEHARIRSLTRRLKRDRAGSTSRRIPTGRSPILRTCCSAKHSLKSLITCQRLCHHGPTELGEVLSVCYPRPCYSPSSSSNALASWRSAVSKPSVNQP